ncbi:MAG: class I SAM-dependent methyltransferase [Bacteroidetes bacterium]|nr:class I SAM-dependent methyltransferase [Bacteroidota bacterium]
MHGHRFEAKHHKRLDSPYRRRILPPKATLERFGLKKGMTVADIGAGSGYFLIPAARIVGNDSKAYALDASKEMLAVLKGKKPPSNVELVHTTDGYSFKIDSGAVDYVIASAILHENEPVKFLKEIRRIMKPGATLLIIDWRKESLRSGPPAEERLSPEQVKEFLVKSKLKPTRTLVLNTRYYAVVAKKA